MPSGPARCSPLKPVLLITPDVQFLSVRLHARSSLHCKYFKMLRIFFPVFKELISGKHTVKCHVFFFKVWWKKKIKWWNGVRCVGFSFLFPCPPPFPSLLLFSPPPFLRSLLVSTWGSTAAPVHTSSSHFAHRFRGCGLSYWRCFHQSKHPLLKRTYSKKRVQLHWI